MYISLDLAKKHLNINQSYAADDDYIAMIIEAAEQAVQATANIDFSEYETIPKAVLFACLLLIGDMYQNRETVAFTSISKIPTFKYLLANFTKYNNEEGE